MSRRGKKQDRDEPMRNVVVGATMHDGELVLLPARKLAPLDDWQLAADYSLVGEGLIGAYAVVAMADGDADRFASRFNASLARWAPGALGTGAEIHATKLLSGRWRASSEHFSHLSREDTQNFLVDLCRRVGWLLPAVCVAVSPRGIAETSGQYKRFGRALLTEAIAMMEQRLANEGKRLAENEVLLDQGDRFDIIALAPTYNADAELITQLRHRLVSAEDSRLVQIADVAAHIVGKLAHRNSIGMTSDRWMVDIAAALRVGQRDVGIAESML